MTRSVYHCSIGLASLKKNQSAINYLLNDDLRSIAKFSNLIEVELPIVGEQYISPKTANSTLSANVFKRKLSNCWRVTSYTELQKHNGSSIFNYDIFDDWDESQSNNQEQQLEQLYDIHHFPKGAYVGTLMHKMMENVAANNIAQLCDEMIKKLNLEAVWTDVVSNWMQHVLSTKLNQQGLTLAQLLSGKCIHELQFYLPIRQAVSSLQLDSLCKQYDPLSKQCPELDFETVQGMLKGFIDLVFEFEGKYYIVDYKSNWLGDSAAYYQKPALEQVMCEHRYELQYQLYCLALHRFLKSRLANYQYQDHFGGVYYLFLRGMPEHGIFYCQPAKQFIEQLDELFDGDNNLKI